MIFNHEGRSRNKASIYETGDTWSEMGYMSKIHVGNTIANFASVMKHYWGDGHPIILLADNLRQHQTLNTLKLSAENGIQLQFLTLNSTTSANLLMTSSSQFLKRSWNKPMISWKGCFPLLFLREKIPLHQSFGWHSIMLSLPIISAMLGVVLGFGHLTSMSSWSNP
jgi:hypothetical protein